MTKLNYLLIIILAFIFIYLLLLIAGVIATSLNEILSYCLITMGIFFVYYESTRKNIFMIFSGSVLFLLGIFFIIVEQFNLKTSDSIAIPLLLILIGTGLLIVYIVAVGKKIILVISVIGLTAGITVLTLQGHTQPDTFLKSILSVINYLWPVFVLTLLIVILIRKQ